MRSGRRLPLVPDCARRVSRWVLAAFACLLLAAPVRAAEPWMWDQDEDGIDDRLTSTFVNGIGEAYENGDPDGRLRFELTVVDNLLQYGGYVRFNHTPTPFDSLTMVALGAQVVTRFSSVPYIRVRAFYPSLVAIATQPTVERVEAVTLMFPMNWKESAAVGVRAGAGGAWPALGVPGGPTGQGVVVAVLDTGINDGPDGGYPGHADLLGKVVGGAYFGGAGPVGYTPWNGSLNPDQSTPGLTSYHATHVGGTIAGSARDRLLGGIAPGAKLVDVKVLDDTGTGSGLAEGLEWCFRNRNRAWGGGATGIQVINLSLSSIDPSDGQDCVSELVNAAASVGIVVVCAAGNDGRCGYIPAPGAADGALTVGALNLDVPAPSGRASLATFSNEGPRVADNDANHLDELKPDLVAPGVGVISSWGSPVGAGRAWRASDGTSMSAAVVSGIVALLKEAAPAATASQIRDVLRRTARHRTDATHGCAGQADPWGNEPFWRAGSGFGEANALAAWNELTNPGRTQFIELSAAWQPGPGVTVTWTTQKELDLVGFMVDRAPDAGGAPGAWSAVSGTIPRTGFQFLSQGNRTTYSFSSGATPDQVFWYRVRTVGGFQSDVSPAVSVRTEAPAALARLTLRHNRPELDWTMALGTGFVPAAPDWSMNPAVAPCIRSIAALSLPTLEERVSIELEMPLYASEMAGGLLPPTSTHPWWLRATEGGEAATAGDITDFRIVIGALNYVTDDILPAVTMEGATTQVDIPNPTLSGVGDPPAPSEALALRAMDNPSRGPVVLRVSSPGGAADLAILDVTGRLVRRLAITEGSGLLDVTWDGRDDHGAELPAGRYYARLDLAGERRVVALTRVR
jgi:subtilisin family serine protease